MTTENSDIEAKVSKTAFELSEAVHAYLAYDPDPTVADQYCRLERARRDYEFGHLEVDALVRIVNSALPELAGHIETGGPTVPLQPAYEAIMRYAAHFGGIPEPTKPDALQEPQAHMWPSA